MSQGEYYFKYDVFLSHSSQDKAAVRKIAERLKADGLRVWFDSWELKPGDSVPAKIEEGLEHSRVLVLCMSAQAFGSDWAQLEAGTFRFRDPMNKERRFIPLRLDNAPIKGSLAQFLYINWFSQKREQERAKLLEACRPPAPPETQFAEKEIQLEYQPRINAYAFSPEGGRCLTCASDRTVRLWDLETKVCLRVLKGHSDDVWSAVWSTDCRKALSGSADKTVRLWDSETGRCLRELDGHTAEVRSVALSVDCRRALSSSSDMTVRLWNLDTGRCLRVLEGHTAEVGTVALSVDCRRALSGSSDMTVRLWDLETGRCLRVLEGHKGKVGTVALSADYRRAISGSSDMTVRLWDLETGYCSRVLEGHTDWVWSVAWNADPRYALSGSSDKTMRLWNVETGRCLRVFFLYTAQLRSFAWNSDHTRLFSGDVGGEIQEWDLTEFVTEARDRDASGSDQVQYTNAKVLLVGESGAGKTGLSKRLALDAWAASDSTVGAWATQWKLPVSAGNGVEREIWLWDFGGQADQRLIHQLYMDETALAVLVFDGQKEGLFEALGQWDRDLTRASSQEFSKLLVAGRVDAGGLRVSRNQIEAFAKERGYTQFLETSAKTNLHCEELRQAILDGIRWENIPWRSSPLLFKRLKEEIVRLKDAGRVLVRFNELRETLQMRLFGKVARFTDEELRAVVNLLTGPGVVSELKFGSWVLLQPERINAYAQAVIQTLRQDKHDRGCLPEEQVLNGDLAYHSSMPRLEADEERFILLAMHQTLVERGLCLREHTDQGALLIFPSYYRRERPELVGHPAVLVSYRFNGFLDDIYATLVVRLHHTRPFGQDRLWRHAADFKTLTGKQLGVKLTRRAEGAGELEVYFDPVIPVEEKIIFSKYVHEHLLQHGNDVVRLRYYCCEHCGTPVGSRDVAMERLAEWLEQQPATIGLAGRLKSWIGRTAPTIVCSRCERRVPLWDQLEQAFASPEIQQRVRDLEEQSNVELDKESKERALVGEVISTVALAGQISRELTVSDHGIDMEIEFKSDMGEATGRKLYLQLKWSDSYLRTDQRDGGEVFEIKDERRRSLLRARSRRRDSGEVFEIKDERYARHWADRAFPVMLVIGNSEGEVRWMDIRSLLYQGRNRDQGPVKEIAFVGERFDVMSVRRWRESELARPATS